MQDYIDAWRRIGTSDLVLTWLEAGIQIPFVSKPKCFELPNHKLNDNTTTFIKEELKRLLQKGFIKQCHAKPDYISPIGCVPKKSGGFRLITDFRHLNNYCQRSTFKQEDIRTVASIVEPKDYLTSVDLKDGFYHIRVHDQDQHFLSFQFQGQYYSYTVLPFGFCLSPYFFAKTLRPVVKYLRQLGVRMSLYVDDFFICAKVKYITDYTDLVLNTLEDLGLHVNYEKSSLQPSQQLDYLGYSIDTSGQYPVVRAQKNRVIRIKRQIRSVLKQGKASARVIAKVAGLCVSVAWAVSPGKLFLRHLYGLLTTKSSWSDLLYLNSNCIQELEWWLNAIDEWNFREVRPRPIDVQLETDASHLGWGARIGELEAKGDWNKRVACQSSNYRELLAILLALIAFKSVLKGLHVQILSDNVTAGAYINNKGGPVPSLSQVAVAVWSVATEYGILISCKHIAGVNNTVADRLSRTPDLHNWMLHPGLFRSLEHRWGPHSIDRFATFQNAQLPRFNSRFWEPLSEAIDALAQNWQNENNFVNPPWALLPQVIDKIVKEQASATLIAPMWPSQPWFQKLKAIAVTEPVILPRHKNTLWFMGVDPEPKRNKGWNIAAWRVCGAIV